jgi:hypothetical protein
MKLFKVFLFFVRNVTNSFHYFSFLQRFVNVMFLKSSSSTISNTVYTLLRSNMLALYISSQLVCTRRKQRSYILH